MPLICKRKYVFENINHKRQNIATNKLLDKKVKKTFLFSYRCVNNRLLYKMSSELQQLKVDS